MFTTNVHIICVHTHALSAHVKNTYEMTRRRRAAECDFKHIAPLFSTFIDEKTPETLSSPVYANMEFSQLCCAPSVSFSPPHTHVPTANHLRLVCD